MRKISLKTLQKLVSQASDFYGKADLSPGDFFRYTRSPFLAKIFLGIPCSDELFEKINNDISARSEFLNSVEVDIESFVIEIDKKRKKILNRVRAFLAFISFVLIVFIAYLILDEKTVSAFFVSLLGTVWVGGITLFLIVITISKGITDFFVTRTEKYKNLISYLGSQFLIFKNSLEYWSNLSWQNFELEVTKRLKQFGYGAVNTKLSGDEGVDIVVNNLDKKFIIQCKAMKNKIGPAFVRDFVGTISIQGATGGMIISLNGFSSGALETANYSNLHLLSASEFILLERAQLKQIIGW